MIDPNAITVPMEQEETTMEKLARTHQDACSDSWIGDSDAAPEKEQAKRSVPLLPGTVIGRYRIERMLGQGGQAQVFLAVEQDTDQRVVLKTLRRSGRKFESTRRRFRRETLALASLKHENIVRVVDSFEAFGRPFIVLEYVHGETLAEAVIRRRYSNHELLDILLVCCNAMAYAHDLGIVHLDLKPQNILLTDTGTPKITDFGLARNLCRDPRRKSNAHEQSIIGSPAYMAPEQAANKQDDIGPHTDVYALGVMLYQLLTGELPHLEETPRETIARVLNYDPVAPIQINPFIGWELNAICMKALARLPEDRYTGPDELAADLHRFLNDESVAARA